MSFLLPQETQESRVTVAAAEVDEMQADSSKCLHLETSVSSVRLSDCRSFSQDYRLNCDSEENAV